MSLAETPEVLSTDAPHGSVIQNLFELVRRDRCVRVAGVPPAGGKRRQDARRAAQCPRRLYCEKQQPGVLLQVALHRLHRGKHSCQGH